MEAQKETGRRRAEKRRAFLTGERGGKIGTNRDNLHVTDVNSRNDARSSGTG